jgi:hypothetical protein
MFVGHQQGLFQLSDLFSVESSIFFYFLERGLRSALFGYILSKNLDFGSVRSEGDINFGEI